MTCPGRGAARARVKWCAADPGPLRSVTVPDQRCTATQELRATPHRGREKDGLVMDIKGHAAVVTGGASGLGAATASELARAGAKVVCMDVNLDGARAVAREIGGAAVRCDVTDAEHSVAALAQARDHYGAARILI